MCYRCGTQKNTFSKAPDSLVSCLLRDKTHDLYKVKRGTLSTTALWKKVEPRLGDLGLIAKVPLDEPV